jgi:hypothetical protein
VYGDDCLFALRPGQSSCHRNGPFVGLFPAYWDEDPVKFFTAGGLSFFGF